MINMWVFRALLLVFICNHTVAYKTYQDKIPNGDLIPHPCKPNYLWQGVGHNVPGGGGNRNPFGADFEANGKQWDSCLCTADSDGDGVSNGEELGDPLCVWKPGDTPARNTGLTHPGVCEPIDSTDCQIRNEDLGDFCETGETIHPCINDTLQQISDIQEVTIRFPTTPVPSQETTYMCQIFDLPSDQDYHAVAYSPVIDNNYVMHHILIYGCVNGTESQSSPSECGMAADNCRSLLFAWAVGANGYCTSSDFGFLVGLNGFKTVMMQAHWNNPEAVTDYTDSSGLTLYITPTLRPNDGAMLMIGQTSIEIPGSRGKVTIEGECSSACTAVNLNDTIYVTESTIHMHYLGRSGYIKHYRDGTKLTDLVTQDLYSYDVPIFETYASPVAVEPGDYFSVECQYKSSSRSEYTHYGDSTSEEMCFGFLVYYPAHPAFTQCLKYGTADVCPSVSFDIGSCDFTAFESISTAIMTDLYVSCDTTGEECYSECQTKLASYMAAQPCMNGAALALVKESLQDLGEDGEATILAINSCLLPPEATDENSDSDGGRGGLLCGASGLADSITLTLVLLASFISSFIASLNN